MRPKIGEIFPRAFRWVEEIVYTRETIFYIVKLSEDDSPVLFRVCCFFIERVFGHETTISNLESGPTLQYDLSHYAVILHHQLPRGRSVNLQSITSLITPPLFPV